MPGSHNVDQVYDDIKDFVDGFNFTAQTEDKSVGRNVCGVIVDGIVRRSIDEQRSADAAWDALNAKYKAWKIKKYGVDSIGYKTGQMLSHVSLLGDIQITPELVTLLYGTGAADPDDSNITDIEKAFFFSNRRPFFELDDQIADAAFARIEELLEDYLRKGTP